MDDVLKQLDHELLAAANLLRYAGDAAKAGRYIAAARELIRPYLVGDCVPLGQPAQRWVLTQGKDDIAFTTDTGEAYELARRCRDMADAVLYLEIVAPMRVPVEQSRAKQDPISSFPAAAAASGQPDSRKTKCHYCDSEAKEMLVWLKDKKGKNARIRLPWCGCDLQVALKRFWPSPYQVVEGVDYEREPLDANLPPAAPRADTTASEGGAAGA